MKSLLIVIDLQKGWRHKATEKAMLNTVKLCKNFQGNKVHCCFRNHPQSLFFKQLNWTRFISSNDTDEIPEIKPFRMRVFWRSSYSCLTPELVRVVKHYDQVYIAGVFTNISVFVSALDVFDRNIPVAVVSDCVATLHGDEVNSTALKSLDFALGKKGLVKSSQIS